ncbi:MAG: hypothetical protein LAT83_06760 [Kiritimatiellae bacterium]|nr:hypothetical protein [Kiritimatiellia bacterium]
MRLPNSPISFRVPSPFKLVGLFIAFALPSTFVSAETLPEAEAREESAFLARADFYIRRLADRDLDEMHAWFERTTFFRGAGGDRHKYAMGPLLARLALDREDEQAIRMYRNLMEVDKLKGDRGLYHFASFQKTRMFFQMWDELPEDFREAIEYDVRNHYNIMRQGGTENHYFMNRTSGYVWAERLDGEFPGAQGGREGSLSFQRNWLIDQVRKNYAVGNSEYDSSTYLAFSAAGWSNIYDFSEDPVMKDKARAMLDWYAVAIARKYFHGLSLGPESRGFATLPVGNRPAVEGGYEHTGTHSDWLGWLWWEGSASAPFMDRPDVGVTPYPIINLALSEYRPHRVIRNIARKQVPLPYEARGSKPQYRMTNDLDAFHDHHNKDQEILFINSAFAMGTLYNPDDGIRTTGTILPQTTMFKLAARDGGTVRVFGMSNGYHGHSPLAGRTPYDQYHQHRGAAINICYVHQPDDSDHEGGHDGVGKGRTVHRSIFGYPPGIGRPVVRDGWYFWEVGDAFVATYPLGGTPEDQTALKNHNPQRTGGYRYLVTRGELGGWIVQAAQRPEFETLEDFQAAVLERSVVNTEAFDTETREITYTCLEGHTLKMRHTGGPGGKPEAWTNGEQLIFENWPVYESPYVRQEVGSGIIELNDGKETLVIDIPGDRITWTEGLVEETSEEPRP